MSQTLEHGYAFVPYMHNHESVEMKEAWSHSKNVQDMYFATATFSPDSRPFFEPPANHYILVKFKDGKKILKEIQKHKQDSPSFVFCMREDLFERDTEGKTGLISVYYLEYGRSDEDIGEVAGIVGRREKVGRAGIGRMELVCRQEPRFRFPYAENIVILEVSSDKSHRSVNKYCEKTRRDIGRKGITMTNLVSLSILERMK